jgi:hypothetical protein
MKNNNISVIYILTIVLSIPIIFVGFFSKDYSQMLSNLILAGTGILVAWYTLEAYKQRKISDEQLRNSVRPFFKLRYSYYSYIHEAGIKKFLSLENIGIGHALNVSFKDVEIKIRNQAGVEFIEGKTPSDPEKIFSLKISPSQIIKSGEVLEITTDGIRELMRIYNIEKDAPEESMLLIIMDDNFKNGKEVVIKYSDIKNNHYKAVFRRNIDIQGGFEIVSQDLEN